MATDEMLDLLQRAWQMGYDKANRDGRSGQQNMVDASAQFRANYRAPDLEEIARLHAARTPEAQRDAPADTEPCDCRIHAPERFAGGQRDAGNRGPRE